MRTCRSSSSVWSFARYRNVRPRVPSAAPGVERRGVLYVGRTLAHKGLREVCEAYLTVEPALADDPLLLIGMRIDRESFERTGFWLHGDRRARLERLIHLGRVRLLGEVHHERA